MLAKLYYNPKEGYISKERLYQKAMAKNPNITRRQVDEFLKEQPVAQKVSKQRVPKQDYPIQGPVGAYQIDLAFIPQYKATNKGYQAILTCVDAIPMKNKNTASIVD